MRSPVLLWARRLSVGLGVAAVVYAGGVAAYADISQRYRSWRFDQVGAVGAGTAVRKEEEEEDDRREGDTVGRLEIPRVGISVMILQGTEAATLIGGAGLVPGTPSPGGDGNVVVAAHRDTFFRTLDGIRPGDGIRITTAGGLYEYVVDSTEVVDPEDTRVMESRARPELTLITCYPFYFVGAAPKRFIVHARPRSAADPSHRFQLIHTSIAT